MPLCHTRKTCSLLLRKRDGTGAPGRGPETRLQQGRPPQYLGHGFCHSCRPPPHIPRLREAVWPCASRAPSPFSLRDPLSPPLTAATTFEILRRAHPLAGWTRSRDAAAQPKAQAEPRPAGRPHVTQSRRESASGHPSPPPAGAEPVVRRFSARSYWCLEAEPLRHLSGRVF